MYRYQDGFYRHGYTKQYRQHRAYTYLYPLRI
nr:MAG TPA: hypothetical protein [Caudoviricetes sp.]